jgi:ABC-type sugar transport system ATPase subunit
MMEVIGMADRVTVMSRGHVTGFLERAEITEANTATLADNERR